jgi:hypothetical protein
MFAFVGRSHSSVGLVLASELKVLGENQNDIFF